MRNEEKLKTLEIVFFCEHLLIKIEIKVILTETLHEILSKFLTNLQPHFSSDMNYLRNNFAAISFSFGQTSMVSSEKYESIKLMAFFC